MMVLNSSSINVSSHISNVSLLMKWLEENLFKFINDRNKVSALSLVAQEAIVNAIVHGNKEIDKKQVKLSFELLNSKVHIKVEDEGDGIPDINKNKVDFTEEDLLKESGRGIVLMKNLCKDVIFEDSSVELIMEI